HQRCDATAANPQHATTCVITGKEKRHGDDPGVPPPAGLTEYLIPTRAIDSHDPDIRATAQTILNGTADVTEQIGKLVGWLQKHVTQKPVDVFTARDVFERREAECQGLTLLYSALARSVGIPTRVTNGVVYLAELDGFLYHTWAESYVGTGWLPVDPTFGQIGVDATHLKLVDGESTKELLPLVKLIGKLRITVLDYQYF
ncbi:MAG: transglutaminase-like domain-containing protein, partial [Nitrospirales bacterium]